LEAIFYVLEDAEVYEAVYPWQRTHEVHGAAAREVEMYTTSK